MGSSPGESSAVRNKKRVANTIALHRAAMQTKIPRRAYTRPCTRCGRVGGSQCADVSEPTHSGMRYTEACAQAPRRESYDIRISTRVAVGLG